MRKQRQDTVKQGKGLTLKSSGELTKLRDHYFKRQNDRGKSALHYWEKQQAEQDIDWRSGWQASLL